MTREVSKQHIKKSKGFQSHNLMNPPITNELPKQNKMTSLDKEMLAIEKEIQKFDKLGSIFTRKRSGMNNKRKL